LRERLRRGLLSHLARATHALSSLKSILLLYDDDNMNEDILPVDFDFREVGFHERVDVEYAPSWLFDCFRRSSSVCRQNTRG
jgi:hypothetical protein